MTAPVKRVYGPYGKCRANCGLGLDLVLVDDPTANSGILMWCAVAQDAAEEARLKVRQLRPKKDAA